MAVRKENTVHPLLAEILGPDLIVILVVILVLFGGSQLPKLARSLGSASHEFRKGLEEGQRDAEAKGTGEGKAAEEKAEEKKAGS